MARNPEADRLLCPSSQPNHPDARVFGVQTGHSPETFRVGYLTKAHPVTAALLAQTGHALPTEVLRIAAPCIRCSHHDGTGCRLAARVATMLPPVVGAMPRCAIRSSCLWFRQEGRDACVRCPQVVTIGRAPTAFDEAVAGLPAQRAEELPAVAMPAPLRPDPAASAAAPSRDGTPAGFPCSHDDSVSNRTPT